LNGVTKLSHVDQQGSNLSEGEDLGGELHCYHCLLRYASLQIEAQLDELEKKTENGDLDEIQSYSQANH
jgi:hypothetical protein